MTSITRNSAFSFFIYTNTVYPAKISGEVYEKIDTPNAHIDKCKLPQSSTEMCSEKLVKKSRFCKTTASIQFTFIYIVPFHIKSHNFNNNNNKSKLTALFTCPHHLLYCTLHLNLLRLSLDTYSISIKSLKFCISEPINFFSPMYILFSPLTLLFFHGICPTLLFSTTFHQYVVFTSHLSYSVNLWNNFSIQLNRKKKTKREN